MLRNIFLVLTVFGCGILIPVNVVGGSNFYKQWHNIATLMKVFSFRPAQKLRVLIYIVHAAIYLRAKVLGFRFCRIHHPRHRMPLSVLELQSGIQTQEGLFQKH